MAEIELWGMEVIECMSPRVSYSFLQRVQRCGPGKWGELNGMAAIFICRACSRRPAERDKRETYPSSAATRADR